MPAPQPPIRSSQLGGAGSGDPARSINLFRGDVNLTQTLFSLPGISAPLEVSVALQYQSNVAQAAATWNADAPTSVVGFGWSLPLTYIELEPGASPVQSTRQLTFYDNGNPNPLYRQAYKPSLLVMPSSYADGLKSGPVPADIRQALLDNGLALSASATLSADGSVWVIDDAALQQLYELRRQSEGLVLFDGGDVYQADAYTFDRIIHYGPYERWVIVGVHGVRRSLGGLAPAGGGYPVGLNNSVCWQVWSSADETHASSLYGAESGAQVRVARAWYLSSVQDRSGNAIQLNYNAFAQENGCIDGVERRVGAGGLPFTRAIYLTSIIDSCGRLITFDYLDKSWGPGASDVREYSDPHYATPSDQPSPYQDCYETRYLAGIRVQDGGHTLMSFAFGYTSMNFAGLTPGQPTYGDTCKRVLQTITQSDAAGVEQPPFRFTYGETGQPGALSTVTEPQGAVTTYTYTLKTLASMQRSTTVTRPYSSAATRVFFGNDYAATVFADEVHGGLSLQLETWVGSWRAWTLNGDPVIDTGSAVDLDTLQVMAADDFVAVAFQDFEEQLKVYVFQRDTNQPGQWTAPLIGTTRIGKDSPLLTSDQATFHAGASFFVIQTPAGSACTLQTVTYRWSDRVFALETPPGIPTLDGRTTVVAGADYYAVLPPSGQLLVYALDVVLCWSQVIDTPIGEVSAQPGGLQVTPGAALLAVSRQTSVDPLLVDVRLVWWNAQYTPALLAFSGLSVRVNGNAPDLAPAIVDDGLVGVAGHLFRRVGADWQHDASLAQYPPQAQQVYAYGQDVGVLVTQGSGGVAVMCSAYDPTTAKWSGAKPVSGYGTLSSLQTNLPTVSGRDWINVAGLVFFRDQATDWSAVLGASPTAQLGHGANDAGFVPGSMIDAGPDFLAYSVNQSVQTWRMQNGQVIAGAPLAQARLESTPQPGLGEFGQGMFASFGADVNDMSVAPSITLHRFTGQQVDGAIQHYTVTRVEEADGISPPVYTTIDPTLGSAGCDATGLVAKFYAVTVYPGSKTAADAGFGKVHRTFFNGAKNTDAYDDYHQQLDGLLIQTQIYVGNRVVQSRTTGYEPFTEVATGPGASDGTLILHGSIVLPTSSTEVRDGVTTKTTYAYGGVSGGLPFNGQRTVVTRSQQGAQGQDVYTRTTTYPAQGGVAALQAIGAVADVIQVTDACGGTTVQSTVTTFDGYPSAWSLDDGVVLAPAPEAEFNLMTAAASAFDFAGYTPGDTPDGWRLSTRVLARHVAGPVTHCQNAQQVSSTLTCDRTGALGIGQFGNVAPDGMLHHGFQAYEDMSPWHGAQAVVFDDSVAYAGTRSARLSAGASLASSITRPDGSAPLLVACRYRTSGAPSGGLTIATTTGPQTLPWDGPAGAWHYTTMVVETADGVVDLSLTNSGGGEVWLDTVLVVPLCSSVQVATFDPVTLEQIATQDASGRCLRSAFTAAGQESVSVSAAGQVQNLVVSGLSRAAGRTDAFSTVSPNVAVRVDAAAGGTLETFRDGGDWATRWQGDGWTAQDGTLVSQDPQASLTYLGDPGAGTAVLYVEPTIPAGGQLSIGMGNVVITWDGTQYTNTIGWANRTSPEKPASQWMLVIADHRIIFLADGHIIYSNAGVPHPATFAVSGRATLRNLAVVGDARVGVSYTDGALRVVQTQQSKGGDALVRGEVFDAIGRPVATTRVAPASASKGAILAYRSGFVDLADFATARSGKWQMSGDIADFYPEDGGYPYWGTAYEASMRAQRTRLSQPGVPFAMKARPNYAFKMSYGASDPAPGLDRGLASTFVRQASNQYEVIHGTLSRDVLGNVVALDFADKALRTFSRNHALRAYADASGPTSVVTTDTPLALRGQPQPAGAYQRQITRDGAQQPITYVDADSGTTTLVYDSVGRPRFALPTLAAGVDPYILYTRYDAVGREVERGVLSGAYTPASLEPMVDEPDWPADGQTSVATTYDGDGGTPNSIGRKTQTVACNADCQVTEVFTYDDDGNVQSVVQTLTGSCTASATLSYAYDALGEVTRLTSPEAGMTVVYTYDDQGNVATVSEGSATLATCQYDPDGQLSLLTQGQRWSTTHGYTAAGWLRTSQGTSSDAALQLNVTRTYQADGTVLSRTRETNIPGLSTAKHVYGYDQNRRLSVVDERRVYAYDANGNIESARGPDGKSAFVMAPGGNRIDSVTTATQGQTALTYSPQGFLTADGQRTYTYDPCALRPCSVQTDQGTTTLAYGGSHQRVLRRAPSGAERVYFSGAGAVPVLVREGDAWQFWIQGPAGMVAQVVDGAARYPLSDAMGSVWVMLDDTSVLATADYLPYGELESSTGDPSALTHRFHGMEWDDGPALVNFGARLYDPGLRRFVSPDPRRQLASPYAFAAGDPLSVADPSGELGVWARVGIGVGLLAATVMVTVATAGVGDSGMVALDSLALTEDGSDIAGGVLVNSVENAEGEGLVEGEGLGEGVAQGSDATVSSGMSTSADEMGTRVADGVKRVTLKSIRAACIHGMVYDVKSRNFRRGALFKSMGIGAAFTCGGSVFGELTGIATQSTADRSTKAIATRVSKKFARKFAYAFARTDVHTIVSNTRHGYPWYRNLGNDSQKGAVSGGRAVGVSAAIGTLFSPIPVLKSAKEKGFMTAVKETYPWTHELAGVFRPGFAVQALDDAGQS